MRSALRPADPLTRRRVLAALAASCPLAAASRASAQPAWQASDDPFTLGVASGDPSPDGFVLWTRLAPRPLEGGGMPTARVPVDWEIATDESMRSIVRRGRAWADPALAHSVHVEVEGLEADRWYWYRFEAGGTRSAIGRTRTAPAFDSPAPSLAFAFVSCQNYEHGQWAAFRHLAEDNLSLVIHLGDYIYEGSTLGDAARRHESPREPMTLAAYRNRHACYRMDASLRLAHQRLPWIVTWDDHEVENDYAADLSENRDDRGWFLARRAAAYQAYYEHMPLRRASLPRGPDLLLYRRLAWGDLATFHVLDNRQHRTDQPCGAGRRGGGNHVEECMDRNDPSASMWGESQERWLDAGLVSSRTRWNVLAQSLMMAQVRQRGPEGGDSHWTDGWDGLAGARRRFLARLAEARRRDVVSIAGDVHAHYAGELRPDFDDERSPSVATEFVCTSISSRGPSPATVARALPLNPHLRYGESRYRGYVRCDVSARRWLATMRGVERIQDPQSPVRDLASFVVEAGRAAVQRG